MVFDAVAEVSPKRVLEVGCGMGQLAERMHVELDAEVVMIDQSERMVELTRKRGVDARVADVQELPFDDGEFDVVVAAWMPSRPRRRAGARRDRARAAACRSRRHRHESTRAPEGAPRARRRHPYGTRGVRRRRRAAGVPPHFAHIEGRDAAGTVTFADRDAVAAYMQPSLGLFGDVGEIPSWTALSSSRGGR